MSPVKECAVYMEKNNGGENMKDINVEHKIPSPLDDVFTAAEAAALWGLDESTVKKACLQGRFRHYEAKKSGWPWLVTRQGMERLYGPLS